MLRSIQLGFVCAFVALAAIACGEDTPTAPTPPPAPTLVTDTFTGTLNSNGAASHDFVAGAVGGGSVTATLTNVDPETTVGLAVGIWNASQVCTVQFARDQAVKTTVLYGTVNGIGQLCVRIYDVGNVTTPVAYEITVVHP